MFVGREKELRDLDKMYRSDKFESADQWGITCRICRMQMDYICAQ